MGHRFVWAIMAWRPGARDLKFLKKVCVCIEYVQVNLLTLSIPSLKFGWKMGISMFPRGTFPGAFIINKTAKRSFRDHLAVAE